MTPGDISIRKLEPQESDLILKIAHWYFDEWGSPVEKTAKSLTTQAPEEILFHLVMMKNGALIGTAGVYHEVNLFNVHSRFRKFTPWLALFYMDEKERGRGMGAQLLEHVDIHAREAGISQVYLYTFTAERLYARCGWRYMETVRYKDHDTAVMDKIL